jgi:hypothetical protein
VAEARVEPKIEHAEKKVQQVLEHAQAYAPKAPAKRLEKSSGEAVRRIGDVTLMKGRAENVLSRAKQGGAQVGGLRWGSEEERRALEKADRLAAGGMRWGSKEESEAMEKADKQAAGKGARSRANAKRKPDLWDYGDTVLGGLPRMSDAEFNEYKAELQKRKAATEEWDAMAAKDPKLKSDPFAYNRWMYEKMGHEPGELKEAQLKFERLGKGNEEPTTIVKDQDSARKDSEERVKSAKASGVATPESAAAFGLNMNARSTSTRGLMMNEEVSSQWLGTGFLGSAIQGRFKSNPPVLSLEPPEFFKVVSTVPAAGVYFPGSNHIAVDANVERAGNDADTYRDIAHEQLHYASWLGGGFEVRWLGQDGMPQGRGYVSWLQEGATEYFAEVLTRDHGKPPSYVPYQHEVECVSALVRIVGFDAVKNAYLGGDFTQVKRALDAGMGTGVFENLMNAQNGAEGKAALGAMAEEATYVSLKRPQ